MTIDAHWLTRISPGPDLGFRELAALGGLDPYGQHQLLWKFFDLRRDNKPARTEFLFRAEVRNRLPLFYVLSRLLPADQTGRWQLVTREYRPNLCVGDGLAFKLRANPVSLEKRDRDPDTIPSWNENRAKKGLKPKNTTRQRIRHDVVMDAKKSLNWNDLPPTERPSLNQITYEAGSVWLRKRVKHIGCRVDLDRLRVDGHRVHRMKWRRGIVVSMLDYEGELEVTDPVAFVSALFSGIGPAKAFGCGLMLVRRITSI